MKDKGIIPTDFNSLSMLDMFPMITKETIKNNYQDFIPKNIKKIRGIKTSQTGGTTGSILIKRNDASTRSSIWGAYRRFENWMSYYPGEKALILMGGHVIHHHNLKDIVKSSTVRFHKYLKHQVSINPYGTDPSVLESIINILKKNDVKLIRGYGQYLYNLCQVIQNMGVQCKVPLITTTAEPLMPEHRRLFKEVLGADAFDQYGCGEIGGIAFECEKHEGMHITEERVIVEQNMNNDLIVTDLDNYAMPFIRYYNADQALISLDKCSCGREHRLIKQVMGRTCDYVLGVNGQYLHWAYFWHLVFDSGISKKRDLKKFQIVQESQDTLIFKYVAEPLDLNETKVMSDNIKSRLGDMEIRFDRESDIPNTESGKYRPVINKLIS
jgi:phenylacetate-CoA ligase